MARKRAKLSISEEGLQHLQNVANSRTEAVRKVERAKIMLLVNEGKSNDEIAKEVNVSITMINNTIRKWKTFGAEVALEDLSRPGAPSTITIEAKTWVIHLACQIPKDVVDGPPSQLWTVNSLSEYVRSHAEKEGYASIKNVSNSTIWNILKDNSLKPHQIKYYLVKKYQEFNAKCKSVLLLYKRFEWILQFTKNKVETGEKACDLDGETIISNDEKPEIQAIINIAPDLNPTSRHSTAERDYEYRKTGIVTLLASINLLDGNVTGLVRDAHRSEEFIEFLEELDKKYDKNLVIRIILDNNSTHKSKKVMDYLSKKENRFAFTFNPKHASWLNIIECFFSKFARQCLNKLMVRSKDELKEIINKWIDAVNETPVIFRWKWKLEDIMSAYEK